MKNNKILKTILLSIIVMTSIFAKEAKAKETAPDSFILDVKDTYVINTKKYIPDATISQRFKKNTDGKIIYCANVYLPSISSGRLVYTKLKEADSRYAYVLANGYPNKSITGNNEKDYFITNLAIWYINSPERMQNFNLKNGTYKGKYNDSVAEMAKLVNGANNYKPVTPSISVSNGTMEIKDDKNYYESSYMTIKMPYGVNKYKVTVENATKNTIVTNKNGNVQNEFNRDEGFIIKVPVSEIKDNKLEFKVVVSAHGKVNKAYLYKPNNPSYQQSVALYPEDVEVKDSTKLNINVMSTVEISKVDATNEKELPGATLTVKDENGKVIETFVSTNEKHVIKGLKPGKYTLIEEKAPEGYELSKEVVHFEVKSDGYIVKVKMVNKLKNVPVIISKKDITDESELPGAHLEIRNSNNELVLAFISTDKPFIIEKGLKPGKYTLTEVLAPEGYELSKEKVEFVVKEDGTVDKMVVMYNKPETEIEVPSTGSYKTVTASLVGIIVIGLGLYLIRNNIKKNEEI